MIYSEDSLFVKSNEKPATQVFIPDILNQESIIETSDYVFDEDFNKSRELDKIIDFIILLRSSENRDVALKELNNKRDKIPNLAGLLWYSSGTVAILLQEIINVYPFLTPSYLTQGISERICNVLGLFQCISLDSQTRKLFIKSNLPLYLYPLINTSPKQKSFEHLRITSLGVIGALVKSEDSYAINFLMKTELIVLCLRIMKKGNELCRTVATFIIQKILIDKKGLEYISETDERFTAVAQILKDIIEEIKDDQKIDQRLFRHIIRCYLRLSENSKANHKLRAFLPESLIKKTIQYNDPQIVKWHNQLLENLNF